MLSTETSRGSSLAAPGPAALGAPDGAADDSVAVDAWNVVTADRRRCSFVERHQKNVGIGALETGCSAGGREPLKFSGKVDLVYLLRVPA